MQAVGDQRLREISKEGLESSCGGVDGHVHQHKVDAVICRQTGSGLQKQANALEGGGAALTLVKQLLDVILVRLVPADAVKTFCGQTCRHKQVQLSADANPASPSLETGNRQAEAADKPAGVVSGVDPHC